MSDKKHLLFVCVENSCRSQMAEALARMEGGDDVRVFSAGSEASGVVNPRAIEVMRELGYDLGRHASKRPEDLPVESYDVVVSMGCGDKCPAVPAATRIDWDIPDPKAMPLEEFRVVRDDLRRQVKALLDSIR
jgi:protein-tyrosine-phosphatase